MLDYMATAALAVPGVVLGIGYLRTFQRECAVLTSPWRNGDHRASHR